MIIKKWKLVLSVLVACCCPPPPPARAEDTPRATIQSAIEALGGEQNIAKTLTGTLTAKAKLSLSPEVQSEVTWQETFELPRRYRRNISGQVQGKDLRMEYAIIDGDGWIRRDGGESKDWKGEKLPLNRYWNAILAVLPTALGDQVKLDPGGKEMIAGHEAVGVKISGEPFGGEAILFFDTKSKLLAKSRRRMQHPLSRQDVDAEVFFSDYKAVSGVQYPRRIATYIEGKKVIEMEITRIELLKKLDDRLFEKP